MAHSSDARTSSDESLYAIAFRDAPAGCAIVDATQPRAVGFIEVNDEFARLFGYEAGAMRGMSMWDVTHPSDMARSTDAVRRLHAGEARHMVLEKRFVRRDGGVFWGVSMTSLLRDADGTPSVSIVHVQDVSERKDAQLELERRRDQLEQSQRQANIGNFELRFDPASTFLSDQMYRILGLDPGAAPPSPAEHLAAAHPDDRDALRAAADTWHRAHLIEYRLWRPDGRMVVVEAISNPILDEGGLPAGVAGAVRDITRERAVEAALHEAERIQSAFEVSPLAHVVFSLEAEPAVVVAANAAASMLTGRAASSMKGMTIADLTWAEAVPEQLRAALRGKSTEFAGPLEVTQVDRGPVTVDAEAHVLADDGTGHTFVLVALRERVVPPQGAAQAAPEAAALSSRERQVLELVADGSPGAEIARALHVSPETVKTHLRRIYLKLHVNDRAAAVASAMRRGLIQ